MKVKHPDDLEEYRGKVINLPDLEKALLHIATNLGFDPNTTEKTLQEVFKKIKSLIEQNDIDSFKYNKESFLIAEKEIDPQGIAYCILRLKISLENKGDSKDYRNYSNLFIKLFDKDRGIFYLLSVTCVGKIDYNDDKLIKVLEDNGLGLERLQLIEHPWCSKEFYLIKEKNLSY